MNNKNTAEEKRTLDARIKELRLEIDSGVSLEQRAELIDLRVDLCNQRWELESDGVRYQVMNSLDKSRRRGTW